MNALALDANQALLEVLAHRYHLSFVALFGSTARDGRGRDIDVAVMPADPLPEFVSSEALYLELCETFAPHDVDLAILPNASWLLNWHVARDGKPLVERTPGCFADFCQAAYCRRIDSEWWRRAEKNYIQRFLAGEKSMDRELIQRKLSEMTQYLDELAFVAQHDLSAFESNKLLLRTGERDIELLVECAARINIEIGQEKGIPPSDYYSSFFALVPEWVDREVAKELAGLVRLRNLLVHQYDKVLPYQVHAAVLRMLPLWKTYLVAVSTKI